MDRLVKADFIKIRRVPSYFSLLSATFVLSILLGLFFLLTINITEGRILTDLTSLEVIDITFLGIDAAAILMIVFSALFISKEVSEGTIHTNLALTPNRLKFFMSKVLFLSLVSLIMTVLVILALLAVSWLVMYLNGMGSLELFNQDVFMTMIGSLLMVVSYSLLSAVGSFFTQKSSGGIVFSLGLMFIPALIRMLPENIGDFILPIMPESAINAFMSIGPLSGSLLLALFILLLWILLTSAVSYRKFQKIDY